MAPPPPPPPPPPPAPAAALAPPLTPGLEYGYTATTTSPALGQPPGFAPATSYTSFDSMEEHEAEGGDLVRDLTPFDEKRAAHGTRHGASSTTGSGSVSESLLKPGSSTLDAASSLLEGSYHFVPPPSGMRPRDDDNASIVDAYAHHLSNGSMGSLSYHAPTQHTQSEEDDDAERDFAPQNLTADELRELEEQKRHRSWPSRVRHTVIAFFYWVPLLAETSWTCRMWLLMAILEAAANITIEVVLFRRFRHRRSQGAYKNISATLPTFVATFALAHVYNVVLSIDACVNKNMILIWGIIIFNACMLIYAGIQTAEIKKVLGHGVIGGPMDAGISEHVYTSLTAAVIGLSLAVYLILSYFIHREFGGRMYRIVAASVDLRKRFVDYNVYIALLKFDLFIFFAFCVQLIIVVLDDGHEAERIITIVATPLSAVAVFLAQWAVRVENKPVMYIWLVCLLAGLTYFIFKLIRIWTLHNSDDQDNDIYRYTFKSLTIFAALALALLLTTIGVAIRCIYNFDRGLKMVIVRAHLSRNVEARKKHQMRQRRRQEMAQGAPDVELQHVAPS